MPESKAVSLLRHLARGALPAATPEGLALGELAAAARQQGVTGLLLGALDAGRIPWAEPLRDGLLAERRRILVRSLGQIALSARVSWLLAARGIRALPLKGAAIAETVCEIESDRPMSDVDLLALEGWPDAVGLLRAAAFVELDRADHACAFRDPVSGGVLELHRSVTSASGLFPLDREGAWSRRRAGRGQQQTLPSAEDLLLWLGLHASFQHGLVLSLVQWLDFRLVLEREPIDFGRLRELALAARAATPLAASLLAAEVVVGVPLPEPLRPLVERLPRGTRVWLSARLDAPASLLVPFVPPLGRTRWELLAGRRAELLRRTLVLPETPDGKTRLVARLAWGVRRSLRLAGRLARRGSAPR